MKRKLIAAAAALPLFFASAAIAHAQGYGGGMGPGMMSGGSTPQQGAEEPSAPNSDFGPGYGMGPGMMGGYGPGYGMGPGMMGGYGPGYGTGPGMMGGYGPGYGMGPGMMGGYGPGYGMGPGMMGGCGPGYGIGAGMMGGYGPGFGMGPGMMYGGGMGTGMMYGYGSAWGVPDLSDEQAAKVEKIYADARQKQWDFSAKTFAASIKLPELLASEAPDRKAVESAYKALSDLRLQQLQLNLDTRAKFDAVLTKEQRARLQNWRRDAFAPWY